MKKFFTLAFASVLTLSLTTTALGISFDSGDVTELTLPTDWSGKSVNWDNADIRLDSGVSLTLGGAVENVPFDQISGNGFVKVNGYSYDTNGTLIRFPGLDFDTNSENIPENDFFTWDGAKKTLTIQEDTDITGTLILPAGAKLVLDADLQIRNYTGVGIDALGRLTIDGEGLLTVDTEENAINVAGNLTTYAGFQGKLTSRGGSAIKTTGNVTMTSATLYLGGWGYYGIDADGDILIGGMKTNIEDLSLQGIKATGDITIDAGAQVSAYTVAAGTDKTITLDDAGTVLSVVPYTLERSGTDSSYPDGYLKQAPTLTDGATFNGWVLSDTSTYTLHGTTTLVPTTTTWRYTTLAFTTGATINFSTFLNADYYTVTPAAGKSIYDYLTGDGLVVTDNKVYNASGTQIGYGTLDFTDENDIPDGGDFFTWDAEKTTLTIRKDMTMSDIAAENCLTLPANTTLVLDADLTIDNGFENVSGKKGIYCNGALTVEGAGDLYIDTLGIALQSTGSLTVNTTGDWNITSSGDYGIQCGWQDNLTITQIGRLTVQADSGCIDSGDIALNLSKPATLTSEASGIKGGGEVTVNTDSTLSITAQNVSSASIYGGTSVALSGRGTLNANSRISSLGTVTVADTLSVNGWTQSQVAEPSSVLSDNLDVYGNAVIPYVSAGIPKITDTVTFHDGATLTISQGQMVNFAHVDSFVGDVNIINNGILKLDPAMKTTDTFNNISGSGYLWFDAETNTSSSTTYDDCTTVTDCRGNTAKAIVVGDVSKTYDLNTTQYNDMSTDGYTWRKSGNTYTLTFAEDVALVLNNFEIGDLATGDSIIINVPSDLLTGTFNINGAWNTTVQGGGTLTAAIFTHGSQAALSTLTINTPITSITSIKFSGNTTINAPVEAASLSATTDQTSSSFALTIASTGSFRLTGEAHDEVVAATFTFHTTNRSDTTSTNIVPGIRLGEGIDVQLPTNAHVQCVPYLASDSDTFYLLVMDEDLRPNSDRTNSASEIYIAATPVYIPSTGGAYTYNSTVATTENGTVTLSGTKNKMNSMVTITAIPDEGYEIGDVSVTYISGREVSVTDHGNGTYTYLQPGAPITVTVTFVAVEIPYENPFSDVEEDDYFYDAVQWAVENGITTGYSDDTFRPNSSCTRAQVVTFLWRAMGEPEWEMCYPYGDVDAEAWYADAVYWATVNGITAGTDEGIFAPDALCSRGQIVTFLYRLAGEPTVTGAGLSDVDTTAYYHDAVQWAVENGITTGYSDGTFGANTICTRAQIVTFLYRYLG